ncbi:MAG TPA: hypothetical protein ENK18_20435 [Deltaproteobacteria bacterium]|nr:hypothetical protein [Deltaproteobacteria bacterium]
MVAPPSFRSLRARVYRRQAQGAFLLYYIGARDGVPDQPGGSLEGGPGPALGPLGHWATGSLGHWVTGSLGHWVTGPLGHWATGSLGHWVITTTWWRLGRAPATVGALR